MIDDVNLNRFYFHRESEQAPVEQALLKIDTLKAQFLENAGRNAEGYIMLKVVEYL